MKTNFRTLKQLALAAVTVLASCEREDVAFNFGDAIIALEEVQETAAIDRISDEVDNMAENVYYTDEQDALAGKPLGAMKTAETLYFLSECVVITTVVTETSIEKTLDFGAGCETANGNMLSGKIYLSYSKDMEADSNTIYTSFEDFYFNNARVSGMRTVVRVRANANGNPQATVTFDIDVTWAGGLVTERQGTKVREWIEGVGNGDWTDNAYLITGNWTTAFWTGNVHQGEVITPLRRELSCLQLVSGVLRLQRNDRSGTLDYGDGSCDNEAVFTYDNGDVRIVGLN
ncbi:MAG: hypothetical protein KDD04_02780 [Sinomicrobium sp.]|nr:hypothetical protein [Sinomicrobium sp.]